MRYLKIFGLIVLVLVILFWLGPAPVKPILNTALPSVPSGLAELDSLIQAQERSIEHLIPETTARIVWYDSVPSVTEYSLVYLHGFSATHPEGDSIHYEFARRYGCNLFLSRMYAHGVLNAAEPMLDVTPENLLASAKKAVAIGAQIGKKVLVMATSTGGTYGLYLASGNPEIAGLILYSPNVDMLDTRTSILTLPWGIPLARLIKGSKYHEYDNGDNPGRRFWTNKYRLEAVASLRLLLDETMKPIVFSEIGVPVFTGYYYKNDTLKDDAVSIPAIKTMFQQLGTPQDEKRLVNFPEAGTHVIASRYHSKDIEGIERETFDFAEEILKLSPKNP